HHDFRSFPTRRSSDLDMLKRLGRLHQVDDVYQTINDLKREDFHNVSLDLIYALPHQTVEQFQNTLDEAFTFGLPHYSTYSLQIRSEEHTSELQSRFDL